MTNDIDKQLKKIVDLLESHPEGLTIESMSKILGIHRQTVTKYLFWLNGARIVHRRSIGAASLHYLKKYVKNFKTGVEK